MKRVFTKSGRTAGQKTAQIAGILALAAGGAAFTASTAHANVEIGATAGLHVFSDTNELGVPDEPAAPSLRNSALFGARIGYFFNDMFGVEGEIGVIPTEARQLVFDVWALAYRAQVVAQFRANKPENKLIPFVLGGIGAMSVAHSDNTNVIAKDTDAELYIGAGVKYKVDNGWGVRGDVRMLFPPDSTGPGFTFDYEVLLSVYKEFGRKEPVKAAPPAPKDTDGDGITDDQDKCPTVAEDKDGFEDADGCPDLDNDKDGILDADDKCPNEAGPKENNGCPDTDKDKDGIVDRLDKCPDQPGPAENGGCPDTDKDGDGIVDRLDKCPDQPETVNGYQDEDGCPDEVPAAIKKFTGVIKGINFKTGSAEILHSSDKTLDDTVKTLTEFADLKMEIGGHTDDVKPGKKAKFATNVELSQARADSVKAYFVSKGVADARLTAKGYGESVPLVPNKNEAGRAKNRRVEFKLISSLTK